jgi:PqqD family protein of HPr-rel-A system
VTLYYAPANDCLIFVPLDGLTALYHRPSAMTHVLLEPAPEIIAALAPAPLTISALCAALELDRTAIPILEERLAELEASGLVARR